MDGLAADKERFSKWVLECKWNNDKLKRQAEVLVGLRLQGKQGEASVVTSTIAAYGTLTSV